MKYYLREDGTLVVPDSSMIDDSPFADSFKRQWKKHIASLPSVPGVVIDPEFKIKSGWVENAEERYEELQSYGQGSVWQTITKLEYDFLEQSLEPVPRRILLVEKKPEVKEPKHGGKSWAIKMMDKSINCLALELPEYVWVDVNANWQSVKKCLTPSPSHGGMKEEKSVYVKDLQDQVREQIAQHDLYNWEEALTEEELICLEDLLLTFCPIFQKGSIGFEKQNASVSRPDEPGGLQLKKLHDIQKSETLRVIDENERLRELIKEWDLWEAEIIDDNEAWPENEMTINGKHYEKILDLQIKRREALTGEPGQHARDCEDQLCLTENELLLTGFVKKEYPADRLNTEKTVYEIPIINGVFYYNEKNVRYRWYQRTDVGNVNNYIHLNIKTQNELDILLSVFRVTALTEFKK